MKIEKNMPMKNTTSFDLRSMEIGESVFDHGKNHQTSNLYALAKKQKVRSGILFSARQQECGLRIWRIA